MTEIRRKQVTLSKRPIIPDYIISECDTVLLSICCVSFTLCVERGAVCYDLTSDLRHKYVLVPIGGGAQLAVPRPTRQRALRASSARVQHTGDGRISSCAGGLVRIRIAKIFRALRIRRRAILRYHTYGRRASRPGQVPAASRRGEVQECGERLQGVRSGGGHARAG
ncbi:jg23497 [Pararge aegeria aegeria]|uniref:Jg23497 protein n=1 Tax=Pararge aegeria aegeria TaxID=348720 RepID=A0A8S4QN46_9NEOP|nr:jg23497 [Pararge aegeria aegeria]